MTPVEKVARAIDPKDWKVIDHWATVAKPMRDCRVDDMRERSLARARAAIAAMREPTEAMVDAGLHADTSFALTAEAGLIGTFTAMIDAALQEADNG